jgi:hypothetical protein
MSTATAPTSVRAATGADAPATIYNQGIAERQATVSAAAAFSPSSASAGKGLAGTIRLSRRSTSPG